MTVFRVPTILELFSASLQSAAGTQVTAPTTSDLMQFLKCDLNPSIENIKREDKGLGRSYFGYLAPGKQSAQWSADLYAILASGVSAGPPAAPAFDNLLVGAMGASVVSFSDTVQAAPTPTTTSFAVSNAASLKVGNMVAVNVGGAFGWQMRPISAIAGNTLTFSIPFGAAPAAASVVQGRIYNLGSAINLYTIVSWLRDTASAISMLSRMAVDSYVDKLSFDCNSSIVSLSAGGPASYVVEKQSPASGTYNGTFPTLPALPTNWTTGFAPDTPYLNGEVYLDTTVLTTYVFKLSIDNGGKQLPVPFGSQFADGVMYGQRNVMMDLEVDGNSANYAYLLDAEQKNPHALFAHTGQTIGQFIGFYSPKMVLGLNDINKSDVTVRLPFTSSALFATAADNELSMTIA